MLAILSKVPKSLWVVLATLLLLSASNYYTFNKGFDLGVMDEKEKNQVAADAALIKDLEKTNKDLEKAIAIQKEGAKVLSVLQESLGSSKTLAKELREQLEDAKNTIHPDCNDLSPERYRLYESILSKTPSLGKVGSDTGTD